MMVRIFNSSPELNAQGATGAPLGPPPAQTSAIKTLTQAIVDFNQPQSDQVGPLTQLHGNVKARNEASAQNLGSAEATSVAQTAGQAILQNSGVAVESQANLVPEGVERLVN